MLVVASRQAGAQAERLSRPVAAPIRMPRTVARQIAEPPAAPARAAVTGLAAKATGGGWVTLSWNRMPGAAGYIVFTEGNAPVPLPSASASDPVRVVTTDTTLTAQLAAGARSLHVEAWYLNPGETAIAGNEGNGSRSGVPSAPVGLTIPTWAGRYRVTLTGITVNRETFDNMLETDGKRDEVYVAANVAFFDKTRPIEHRVVRTAVAGDANGFTGRIPAGRASGMGGLMSGDNWPNTPTPWVPAGPPQTDRLPLLLWEGQFIEGQNVLSVIPTVWEWDGASNTEDYQEWLTGESWRVQARASNGAYTGWLGHGSLTPIASTFGWADRAVMVRSDIPNFNDRPVGVVDHPELNQNKYFRQQTVVLNLKNVEAALASTASIGGRSPGVIEVRYQDSEDYKGDYTLYLLVERVP